MGQQCCIALLLFLTCVFVICDGKSPLETNDYQADIFATMKNQLPHKRYQSNEPSEYNSLHGKIDRTDAFEELPVDTYENLVRLVKEMQKERERLSIRYKPNLGKRTLLYK